MIFKPVLIEKIIAGTKTVTRRPIDGRTHPNYECSYKPGKVYSIQPGMARPTVARIRVLAVERTRLRTTFWDDFEASREGFPGPEEFEAYWRDLYGGKFDGDRWVWRIAFELVEVVAQVCPCCDGKSVVPLTLAGVTMQWQHGEATGAR